MKRREKATSNVAPVAFGFFTLAGAAFIIFSKLLAMDPAVVTGVPVALMVIYAILIVLARGLRLRDDQTGDNFYYMGFVYTLVSLGVSLYQYSSAGGVEDIIRNFGIAVASTIAGIVLRILFNQLRRDPVEFEHTSRLELADAARQVRRQLDGVQYEVAHFRRSSQQMIKESFDESRKQLVAIAEGATGAVEAVTQQAMENVRSSTVGLGEQLVASDIKTQLERATRSLDRINKKMDAAADKLTDASDALAVRLNEIEMPDHVVEVKLQPAVDSLERILATVADRLDNQARAIGGFQEQANKRAEEQRQLSSELINALEEVKGLGDGQRKTGIFDVFRRGPDSSMDVVDSEVAPVEAQHRSDRT